VVVFDVVGHEAAADGASGFVGSSGQPLAVGLHLGTGVYSRQRRRNPAGLQGVGSIGARTDRNDTELGTGFQNGILDALAVGVGAPDFQARRAGHTVTQGAYAGAVDVHVSHVEELQLFQRTAIQLLDYRPGVRTLDLVAVAD